MIFLLILPPKRGGKLKGVSQGNKSLSACLDYCMFLALTHSLAVVWRFEIKQVKRTAEDSIDWMMRLRGENTSTLFCRAFSPKRTSQTVGYLSSREFLNRPLSFQFHSIHLHSISWHIAGHSVPSSLPLHYRPVTTTTTSIPPSFSIPHSLTRVCIASLDDGLELINGIRNYGTVSVIIIMICKLPHCPYPPYHASSNLISTTHPLRSTVSPTFPLVYYVCTSVFYCRGSTHIEVVVVSLLRQPVQWLDSGCSEVIANSYALTFYWIEDDEVRMTIWNQEWQYEQQEWRIFSNTRIVRSLARSGLS